MAWFQRAALLLQRSAGLPALTEAGLAANLRASPASPSWSFSAYARTPVHHRSYGVAASIEDEDADMEAEIKSSLPKVPGNAGKAGASPAAFRQFADRVAVVLQHRQLPNKKEVMDYITSASTKEHVEEIFETLKQLKNERAYRRAQLSPMHQQLSTNIALACARAGMYEKGLVALQHQNPYGLRPSLDAAHVLIQEAGEKNKINMVKKVVRTILANGLNPNGNTANLVLRAVSRDKGGKHERDFFNFADEFYINGVRVWPFWSERLMARAITLGDFRTFEKWASRRERSGLVMTKRIAFCMAKGYALKGDVTKAAEVLGRGWESWQKVEGASAHIAWDQACVNLVLEWPEWLQSKRTREEERIDFPRFKRTLVEIESTLREQGVRWERDVEKDFVILEPVANEQESPSSPEGTVSQTEEASDAGSVESNSAEEIVGTESSDGAAPVADEKDTQAATQV